MNIEVLKTTVAFLEKFMALKQSATILHQW